MLQLGKHHSAVLQFKKLISIPNDTIRNDAEFHLALCHKYLGEKKESLRIFNKLLQDATTSKDLKERVKIEKQNLN